MLKSSDPDVRLLAALADPARLAIVRRRLRWLGMRLRRSVTSSRSRPSPPPARRFVRRGRPRGAAGAWIYYRLDPPSGPAGGRERAGSGPRGRPRNPVARPTASRHRAAESARAGGWMTRLRVATLNILNLADRWGRAPPLLLADTAALRRPAGPAGGGLPDATGPSPRPGRRMNTRSREAGQVGRTATASSSGRPSPPTGWSAWTWATGARSTA
jgi:hypothetical protein